MALLRSALFLLLIVFSSCAGSKKTVYFKGTNPNDVDSTSIAVAEPPEPVIQPDDILSINVTSISSITPDKDPVSIYREGGANFSIAATSASGSGSSTAASSSGYLVDPSGDINFPILGKVQVAGKTLREIKSLLVDKLSVLVKQPVVEVRITNFKISVVGEVNRPGFIVASNQRLTIIEALAAAGDIGLSGRKDNVMVIRQQGGRQHFVYLDLTQKKVFNSPYFYLKQNDIVNVSASVVRRQEANAFTRVYLPVFTSLISAALAAYGIVQLAKN